MRLEDLKENMIISGPVLPERVCVIAVFRFGNTVKLVGKGLDTQRLYDPVLLPEQIEALVVDSHVDNEPFDGDAAKFRLGVEALRLALAYEYDPYFTLSIARVDPLPHQLEAVYDYFLRQPRVRFLLADDPGA